MGRFLIELKRGKPGQCIRGKVFVSIFQEFLLVVTAGWPTLKDNIFMEGSIKLSINSQRWRCELIHWWAPPLVCHQPLRSLLPLTTRKSVGSIVNRNSYVLMFIWTGDLYPKSNWGVDNRTSHIWVFEIVTRLHGICQVLKLCGFVASNGSVRHELTQGTACEFDRSNAVPPPTPLKQPLARIW